MGNAITALSSFKEVTDYSPRRRGEAVALGRGCVLNSLQNLESPAQDRTRSLNEQRLIFVYLTAIKFR